jgi:hypothetical protein
MSQGKTPDKKEPRERESSEAAMTDGYFHTSHASQTTATEARNE